DRRSLAFDRIHGARDGGGESDAVFRVADVVVHGLRNRNDLHALPVELGGIAEGVVTPDGDQVIQAQRLDILLHRGSDVVHAGGDAFLGALHLGETLPFEHRRELLHLRRIGPGTVQIGAAGAVDGAGVFAIEGQNVAGAAGRVLQIDVRQTLPSFANS